ncbi:MAG: universal stress protein [Alphaproteobacteria bacterium]
MRKFLSVVDNTAECEVAVYYAARRAISTGGGLTLLHIISPADFQHWVGVGEVMRDEAIETAENRLAELAEFVHEKTGLKAETVIREGKRREQILALLKEDPDIRIIVLGAGIGKDGPGPLVTALTGQMAAQVPVPVTVVPGHLTREALDELA